MRLFKCLVLAYSGKDFIVKISSLSVTPRHKLLARRRPLVLLSIALSGLCRPSPRNQGLIEPSN